MLAYIRAYACITTGTVNRERINKVDFTNTYRKRAKMTSACIKVRAVDHHT